MEFTLKMKGKLLNPPVRNLTYVDFIFVPAVDFVHRMNSFNCLPHARISRESGRPVPSCKFRRVGHVGGAGRV